MADDTRSADEGAGRGIWLALSGGGFRAALFHYGCLKRLQELGLLEEVGYISATSGGAFTAALLSANYDITRNVLGWDEFERRFLGLVRRGILGPTTLMTAAYALYVAAAALAAAAWLAGLTFAYFFGPNQVVSVGLGAACALLLLGIVLHLSLAVLLYREGAHRPFPLEVVERKLEPGRWRSDLGRLSRERFLAALFRPSESRWQTLNRRAFEGERLSALIRGPRIFITAVDLNTGREIIFSNNVIAGLTPMGCRALWEQQPNEPHAYPSEGTPVSLAVAASTAYPPLFRSVRAFAGKDFGTRLVGCFVDGGVLDNLATNVPRYLSLYIHESRNRYKKSGGFNDLPTFKDLVSRILILDAGADLAPRNKQTWTRLFSMKRLLDVVQNHQSTELEADSRNFNLHVGIASKAIGLRVGPDEGSELFNEEIAGHLASVRTNMDPFTTTECAALAYCGYRWVDVWAEGLRGAYEVKEAPARTFADILPDYCGPWLKNPEEVAEHLRYSRRLLRPLRWLGRAAGL